jgi:(p)ppGpp synthase/HD superfamily hydrolase
MPEAARSASWLTDRFETALAYAARVHRQQRRKGTDIPYVGHLLIVAGLVIEDGGDEDEAIAALLHDAVEDQGGEPRLEDIRARFGARVAAIVDGCTDTDKVPKPPWQARKQAYLEHLDTASAAVRRVSAADKLHNARAILADYGVHGEALWSRFNASRDEIVWYYRSLADTFQRRGPASLATQLDAVVTALEHLIRGRASGPSEPLGT